MSEKKNIDRLFQEQFKDFEAEPPGYVWENIREALEEKKKRRVIPIWFRLSGAAAVLLVGVFLGRDYLTGSTGTDIQEQVVTAPSVKRTTQPDANAAVNNGATIKGSEQVAGTNNGAGNSSDYNENEVIKNGDITTSSNGVRKRVETSGNGENAVASANAKHATPEDANPSNRKSSVSTDNNAAVAHSDKPASNRDRQKSKRLNGVTASSANAVANNAAQAKQKRKANRKSKQGNGFDNTGTGASNNAQAIAFGGKGDQKNPAENTGATDNKQQFNDAFGQDNNSVAASDSKPEKNSDSKLNSKFNTDGGGVTTDAPVIDKSATPNEAVANVAVDTVKAKPENELEKLLREKEEGKKEEQIADASSSKWNIKPQVAPVFYNSLSSGSPIDGQFAGNAKSFDNDLSFGLGIDYALNKRLSVRTGVNRVNLNYATQGIAFYASLEGANNNIATARSRNAAIIVQTQTDGMESPLAANTMKESYDGAMVQTTGYVEVPLEVSYSLLNKRFGIAVIGGVSTLFLNENNVSVISTQGLTTNVGEAENLNNIHFSTNVGLGFKYRFFKSFEANFEPTFKYQVNTYSRDAGNFKPYFIGLYSGISFSF